jgi:hypothetical protein
MWALVNAACIVLVPLVFGVWLDVEIQSQYASGLRGSTDGDSVSIPIAGVALLNTLLLFVVNISWAVYVLIKKRRHA